jgi:hypothetical protein
MDYRNYRGVGKLFVFSGQDFGAKEVKKCAIFRLMANSDT